MVQSQATIQFFLKVLQMKNTFLDFGCTSAPCACCGSSRRHHSDQSMVNRHAPLNASPEELQKVQSCKLTLQSRGPQTACRTNA